MPATLTTAQAGWLAHATRDIAQETGLDEATVRHILTSTLQDDQPGTRQDPWHRRDNAASQIAALTGWDDERAEELLEETGYRRIAEDDAE